MTGTNSSDCNNGQSTISAHIFAPLRVHHGPPLLFLQNIPGILVAQRYEQVLFTRTVGGVQLPLLVQI